MQVEQKTTPIDIQAKKLMFSDLFVVVTKVIYSRESPWRETLLHTLILIGFCNGFEYDFNSELECWGLLRV